MFPILFRIPLPGWNLPLLGPVTSLPIYSYGVMLGLSIVIGWYLTLGLASRDFAGQYQDEAARAEFRDTMANCYVVTAIVAIIGSRLLYVVTNLDEFKTFSDLFAFRRGGLVAYGGFLGGFVGSWLFLRQRKIPLLPWADWAVPSLATGLMVTRIGCYLYGCDFGKRLSDNAPELLKKLGTFPHWPEGTLDKGTGAPAWVQHYDQHLVAFDAKASLPVHPTQLYESLVGLALFGLILLQRKNQKFRGQVFLIFTFGYGVLRYLLEMIRDDSERGSYGPAMSEHILVPAGLLALGIGYAVGVSKAVENRQVRAATQVLAMIPAVVAYVAMKPQDFEKAAVVMLSTSQWVAVITGVAAAIFYGMYLDAANARPGGAMLLPLDEIAGVAVATPEASAEEGAKKKKRKKKSKSIDEAEAAPSNGGEPEAAEADVKPNADDGLDDKKVEQPA